MKTREVKTSELIGAALDWAVAVAVSAWESAHTLYPTMTLDPRFSGVEPRPYPRGEFGSMLMTCVLVPNNPFRQDPKPFCPSTDWSQGGPLIEKYSVSIESSKYQDAQAWIYNDHDYYLDGTTPLIAAMRAIVAANLGYVVSVPVELVEKVK